MYIWCTHYPLLEVGQNSVLFFQARAALTEKMRSTTFSYAGQIIVFFLIYVYTATSSIQSPSSSAPFVVFHGEYSDTVFLFVQKV